MCVHGQLSCTCAQLKAIERDFPFFIIILVVFFFFLIILDLKIPGILESASWRYSNFRWYHLHEILSYYNNCIKNMPLFSERLDPWPSSWLYSMIFNHGWKRGVEIILEILACKYLNSGYGCYFRKCLLLFFLILYILRVHLNNFRKHF